MSEVSAQEYVSKQNSLEEEARMRMPWNPDKCSYELGALRQQVFACRTHGNIGICYSCSIICHTKCDLVELFTKRSFTCDCGTERDKSHKDSEYKCELRKNKEDDIPSFTNKYGQNFKGKFCSCATEYDPEGSSIMLQCVLGLECDEDWYHDYCIMGLSKPEAQKLISTNETLEETIIPGFPALDSFDAYICWKCVSKYDYYIKQLISHPHSDSVIASMLSHTYEDLQTSKNGNKKRPLEDPLQAEPYSIFLKENYSESLKTLKQSLKKDDKLNIFLEKLAPFLINDEPVYEPPEENNDEVDIFKLTSQLLQDSSKRASLIEGFSAFHSMKSKLNEYLKTFADSGKVVEEDDIKEFFQHMNDP
ncbi:hypothetical protein NCAS_0B04380 [Naumovozyma castellii]|uniref:UBR-type domain-containing protein n=1 Tax=Naumovozyma castellii TaxID=27288 RepID=G0VAJ7_NAUCA|nr:hypothetical protein NCAS_0B04380 [Naumovozyma castellii CBS 4309]CCC68522.1 hypothetical protein NCAS_0B04380 [Naumovozyma castellii CBS 4309]